MTLLVWPVRGALVSEDRATAALDGVVSSSWLSSDAVPSLRVIVKRKDSRVIPARQE